MPQVNDSDTIREKVLIIDSEIMICELLQIKFDAEGFDVDITTDGPGALQRDNLNQYTIVLVDLMDKPFSGLDFTRVMKENPETFHIPVIIISSSKNVDDVVNALDAGADDYIAKPFSARELVARVRSLMRRRRITVGRRITNQLSFSGLTLDTGRGTATIDGEPLQLSRTEFQILAMLLKHRGQFYDRTDILHEVWDDASASERSVDTHVSRLRKKMGVYGKHIVNRHGYGYGFVV